MSDEQIQAVGAAETSEELGRIRDILFGAQAREYQLRFEQIRRDLERLQAELNRLREQLAEQDADQGKRLQALGRELRDADEALRTELREAAARLADEKVDRTALGDLLSQVGASLKKPGAADGLLKALAATARE